MGLRLRYGAHVHPRSGRISGLLSTPCPLRRHVRGRTGAASVGRVDLFRWSGPPSVRRSVANRDHGVRTDDARPSPGERHVDSENPTWHTVELDHVVQLEEERERRALHGRLVDKHPEPFHSVRVADPNGPWAFVALSIVHAPKTSGGPGLASGLVLALVVVRLRHSKGIPNASSKRDTKPPVPLLRDRRTEKASHAKHEHPNSRPKGEGCEKRCDRVSEQRTCKDRGDGRGRPLPVWDLNNHLLEGRPDNELPTGVGWEGRGHHPARATYH